MTGPTTARRFLLGAILISVCMAGQLFGYEILKRPTSASLTVIGAASGTNLRAKDEALAAAQRKAVEQACGVFLKAQSKSKNYKLVYDKVLADAVGYIREFRELKTWKKDGVTYVQIRAHVSMQKFEKNWSTIAHTYHRENKPRVIMAVPESRQWVRGRWVYEVNRTGTVQNKLEDFFLSKGIVLMDRRMAKKVSKRDVMLASVKDDIKAIAAIGARFKADVVVSGKATVKYGSTIKVADTTMYKYIATLNIRAIQTDSARLLVSKSYSVTATTLQRGAGAVKALEKLADESAPKLLGAIVEAWRKRAHVSRTTQLIIAGMDFAQWKKFKVEVRKIRGVQAVRLREITEAVASIAIEYRYNTEILADHITELKNVKLKVKEITANRIRLKVIKTAPKSKIMEEKLR